MAPLDSRSRITDPPDTPCVRSAPALTRSLRHAVLLYLMLAALTAVAGGLLPLPSSLHGSAGSLLWRAASGTLLNGAPLAAVLGSLLIALASLVSCTVVVSRRRALFDRSNPTPGGAVPWLRRRIGVVLPHDPRACAGRWPRGLEIFALAAAAAAVAWHFGLHHAGAPQAPPQRLALGGSLIIAAFPLLIVERFFARIPVEELPEAHGLAALLYVPVVVVLGCGALEAAAGLGIGPTQAAWLETGLAMYTAAVAAELAIRGAAACFAPQAPPQLARAPIGSVLAKLLRPRTFTPAAVSMAVKQHFGLDFSRSWAIRFVREACGPVLVSSAVFCWFLSGIVSVGLNERGVYERFGSPVRILQSGLHLVLPWPLGAVRKVEHGVIHSVTIGGNEEAMSVAPGEFVPVLSDGPVGAEDIPPASANRLWDQPRRSEVSYIIASTSADRQSFEMISADLRVLFRVGLDDDSVHRAAYRASNAPALVRTLARELLAGFFATRTLADILGADREAIANELRQQLATRLDVLRTGIEVVAVIVEAAQPPSGAAAAYHHVQAAQIDAITEISMERGRAVAAASVATRDAHDLLNKAAGGAAEAIGAAKIDLAYFQADDHAYQAGGYAFILERYFANLKSALGRTALELLDPRLDDRDLPTLDLRPPRAGMDDVPQRNRP